MRIADRKDAIKMGRTDPVDQKAKAGIKSAITELQDINRAIWQVLQNYSYPH